MQDYRIKKILVPLDFSALSLNALYHAERIAGPSGASITLLHVVTPIVGAVGTSGMMAVAMRMERQLQTESTKRLQKIAQVAMKRSAVEIETKVVLGPVGSMIRKSAERTGANIIIMGTHGASGFFENMLGSNTYHVTTLSDLPVMCVHRRPIASGYCNVVFPVRENTQVMEKLPHALTFAKMFKARVHVVGHARTNRNVDTAKIRRLCRVLKEQFSKHGIVTKTAFTPGDQFADAIVRYAQVYFSSLVVILQDHDFKLVELFGGSFSKTMLHKALSPVLTIPR